MENELEVSVEELVDTYVKAYNDEMFKHINESVKAINEKVDEIYKLLADKK